MAGHRYSLEQINDQLVQQLSAVVARYAPARPGSYTDKGVYFTLNPGRHDRSVGSFCVRMAGTKRGRWNDYATGQYGDLLDLIALACGTDASGAIREARAFLGLAEDTPEARRRRDELAERLRIEREAGDRAEEARREKGRQRAAGLWLSGQEAIAGTPVENYLRGRAIDLRALGAAPRALRYHPDCTYYHWEDDAETGEIFEIRERRPAMLAAICGLDGRIMACHRTWLERGPDGGWRKARIASPRTGAPLPIKKVLGDFAGGAIRLGNGLGPRGGKGARLAECPPDTRVYLAEGIETALSARVLRPEARVLAAVSLANMGQVELPANVAEVVLITDHDSHPQAQAQLGRAIAAHRAAGRRVRGWRSPVEGEDLNDALMRVQQEGERQDDEASQ